MTFYVRILTDGRIALQKLTRQIRRSVCCLRNVRRCDQTCHGGEIVFEMC